MLSYLALFFSAFLSATLLPLNSEIVLLAMLDRAQPTLVLWLIATTGNSLGSMVNWVLGSYLLKFQSSRWFPFKEQTLQRAQQWFERYGKWSLLLAWMPVIGDALTVIAGTMKVRLSIFTLLVVIGKGARYALLIVIYFGIF